MAGAQTTMAMDPGSPEDRKRQDEDQSCKCRGDGRTCVLRTGEAAVQWPVLKLLHDSVCPGNLLHAGNIGGNPLHEVLGVLPFHDASVSQGDKMLRIIDDLLRQHSSVELVRRITEG